MTQSQPGNLYLDQAFFYPQQQYDPGQQGMISPYHEYNHSSHIPSPVQTSFHPQQAFFAPPPPQQQQTYWDDASGSLAHQRMRASTDAGHSHLHWQVSSVVVFLELRRVLMVAW